MAKDPSAALQDLAAAVIGVPAGSELQIFGGETVRVTANIDYRGPPTTATLYAAIGNRGILSFDEIFAASAEPQALPQSIDWVTHTLSVDVPTDADHPGLFDVYVKILETGDPGYPELANVIRIVGAVEFQNFAIASYEKV